MTMIGLFLFLAWTTCAACAVAANRDFFSPAKLFLLYLAVFFGDIFIAEYRVEIVAVYACLLMTAAVLIIVEHGWRVPKGQAIPAPPVVFKRAQGVRHKLLWFLSAIPIAAQVYLIHLMGGFSEYVNLIGFRVQEFRGLGVLITLIKMYSVLSIFYFGVLLNADSVKKKDWLLFAVHFVVFIAIGLLSGSRGAVLGNVVIMIMLYHYMRNRVRILALSIAACVFLAAAWALGVARTGYKVAEGELQTGFSNENVTRNVTTHRYGLIPLNLVLGSSREPNLQYGLTFVSAVTNFVPRALWPEKPDTGGVVLTKDYTGDAWDGLSNLSPGIVTESILNFGVAPGLAVGFGVLLVAMVLVVYWYARLLRHRLNPSRGGSMVRILIYLYVMRGAVSLLFAEFTATMVGLFFLIVPTLALAAIHGAGRRVRTSESPRDRLPARNDDK